MYVGGAPSSTSPWLDKPSGAPSLGPIAFQDALSETAADVAAANQADPTDIDLESVASNALGIADEEEEKKKREKRKQDEADGEGTSSAAPSALEQFEMAQKWLIANNSTTMRIRNSLESAGSDATETAGPDAARIGGVAPANAESSSAPSSSAASKVAGPETGVQAPKGVVFI